MREKTGSRRKNGGVGEKVESGKEGGGVGEKKRKREWERRCGKNSYKKGKMVVELTPYLRYSPDVTYILFT